jgi:hypothetical protein
MSLRCTFRAFRTPDVTSFKRLAEDVARAFGGVIEWGTLGVGSEVLKFSSTPTVQTLELPHGVCDWRFFEQISAVLKAPMLELRIQEESLWDYSLHVGEKCVDTFSTLPQYWDFPDVDEDEMKKWAGNPQLFAEVWKVPLARIERYFINWGLRSDPDDSDVFDTVMEGKAYPTDQHRYGECRQMFDFLAALGGAIPNESHRAVFPKRVE